MALTRKHFTILAEVVGGVEAGRIGPGDLRAVLIEHLCEPEPQFKADKFNVHADKQRDEHERVAASYLKEGEGFVVDNQRLVASKVKPWTDEGETEIEVRADFPSADTDANFVTFYLEPGQRV